MVPQNSVPPVIVLHAASDGQVQVMDTNGNPLSQLEHGSEIALIFVPVLLIEQQLAYKDYVLYQFNSEENLESKINEIREQEENAIVLIGHDEERKVYFVEDKLLVSSVPTTFYCDDQCIIDELKNNYEGKVNCNEENKDELETLIKHLRFSGGRGNEAGVAGTRTGKNVFSREFAPCNAIVARRKVDHQFVLYHATGIDIDRKASSSVFLESIDRGMGSDFTAVMQNPNIAKNYSKAPIIAGRLMVELKDKNVSRINFPEGYSAVACINNNTIIVTQSMKFFHDENKKAILLSQLDLQKTATARVLDLDRECITLPDTAKEILTQYSNEKNIGTLKKDYGSLLTQLGVFKFEEMNLSEEESTKGCCFLM
ncbi:hypothetical protein [Legionella maioricensis]|uniref:Uncharacterized protein n=1 Tax=Legionella maioricensis TaxID=2896528 RepID=A0A9X2CY16_9GAMM|nr:hypothetical protein [Legionella maioricensis]MCL9682799.1 hypothetical protein [Legionella maioricensis]MCL9686573.1 hypothetical protein [Legionella maioricensis]